MICRDHEKITSDHNRSWLIWYVLDQLSNFAAHTIFPFGRFQPSTFSKPIYTLYNTKKASYKQPIPLRGSPEPPSRVPNLRNSKQCLWCCPSYFKLTKKLLILRPPRANPRHTKWPPEAPETRSLHTWTPQGKEALGKTWTTRTPRRALFPIHTNSDALCQTLLRVLWLDGWIESDGKVGQVLQRTYYTPDRMQTWRDDNTNFSLCSHSCLFQPTTTRLLWRNLPTNSRCNQPESLNPQDSKPTRTSSTVSNSF